MCLCEIFQAECMRDLVADLGVSSSHPKTWNVNISTAFKHLHIYHRKDHMWISVKKVNTFSTKVHKKPKGSAVASFASNTRGQCNVFVLVIFFGLFVVYVFLCVSWHRNFISRLSIKCEGQGHKEKNANLATSTSVLGLGLLFVNKTKTTN